MRFFICPQCSEVVELIYDAGASIACCGAPMTELVPGTTDAAAEKHVPVYSVDGHMVTVRVGSAPHPMLPEHHIAWIALQTRQGTQRKHLRPGDAPEAHFALCPGDEVEAVYAYCDLHSLWQA